eukprot:GHVU01123556.1.p3 GENE.GHVU01123556.1~~GHVU01123556.1.p3  ORF type:complete len:122 (+),score=22.08 GHVU01123556.1:247-612(+)
MTSKQDISEKKERPPKSGIAVGINRGHIVATRALPVKHVTRKGKTKKGTRLIREVVREVAGFAPYEKRILELIKVGTAATMKRALKFAKKRLGTHRRGKRKRDEIVKAYQAMRKKAAAAGH